MSFFDEWPNINKCFFFGFSGCNVFFCWWSLLLARFWFFKKIATYCSFLSPSNQQITSLSKVWQEQRTLGVRDLHKMFQNMTSNYLPSFKFCFVFVSQTLSRFVFCLHIPVVNPIYHIQLNNGGTKISTSFIVCRFVFGVFGRPFLDLSHRLGVPNGKRNWVKLHKTHFVAGSWFVFDMKRVFWGGILCFWNFSRI